MRFLRRLFRRRMAPAFRVGDLAAHHGKPVAIAAVDEAGRRAQVIWHEPDGTLRTAGFVPVSSLRGWID